MHDVFNFPVLRFSQVVHMKRELNFYEAHDIADHIKNKENLFFTKLESWLQQEGGVEISKSGEKIEIITRDFPIVGFPAISYKVKDYSVESRNGVTVCAYGYNCKLWTRMSLLRINDGVAFGLEPEKVNEYFDFSKKFAFQKTNIIKKIYDSTLRELNINDDFENPYNLIVKTVNSSDENISDLFSRIKEGKISNVKEALEDKQYADALNDYFKIVFSKRPNAIDHKEILGELKNNKYLKLNGQYSDDYCSIITIIMGESETEFTGITFNKNPEYTRKIPSERSSRETADSYARFL